MRGEAVSNINMKYEHSPFYKNVLLHLHTDTTSSAKGGNEMVSPRRMRSEATVDE